MIECTNAGNPRDRLCTPGTDVTKDLPPCRTLDADDSTSVVLEQQGPGRADIGAGGYADDTEVVAPSAAALRRTVPATEKWLQLTGQDVNVGKSTVLRSRSDLWFSSACGVCVCVCVVCMCAFLS